MEVLRDNAYDYTYNPDGTVTVQAINPNSFSSLSLLRSFINEAIRETVASNRWRDNNEDTYRLIAQLRYAANEIEKVIASGVYPPNSPQD